MENGPTSWIHATCAWLTQSSDDDSATKVAADIRGAAAAELETLLSVLVANFDALAAGGATRWRVVMQALVTRLLELHSRSEHGEPLLAPQELGELYQRLSALDGHAAAHALQVLAVQGDEESLEALATILAESPPQDWQVVALAVSPLWNAAPPQLEFFFEQLGTDIWQAAALSVVLDLANFSVRQGKLPEHPLRSQRAALSRLLGSVVVRLGRLEKSPAEFGDDVAEVQRILNDSVALTISLCDALGWMEDPQAEESLEQALGLSHRRIQVEAAGALARLGSDRGAERLIDLATDPVARLRAVHYAEELDLVHRIDEGQRHPHALAESELAAWLARPEQFGFPPSGMELVESRSLYWPSFEEPQACYLFRYSYALPNGQLSNMGIAGPLTHAFQADLANLPIDDIYAAFAGWQAEHEEIFEVPSAQLNPAQRREADRLQEALTAQGLEIQDTLALTFFLGELALLARVEREGKAACAISDGVELLCYPTSNSPHALTPELVLAIYRGRKLLRTFNADFG